MNEDSIKKKSILYISLNNLLCKRMPEIHKEIEKSILDTGYSDIIEKINCYLGNHSWGQNTQWKIDIEVDSYPCDDTGRPFCLGGYVDLEEVKKRETVYFKTQMFNSFDETIAVQDKIKIPYDMFDNSNFVEKIVHQTNDFLDQFYDRFMTGADIFVQEFRILKSDDSWSDILKVYSLEKMEGKNNN